MLAPTVYDTFNRLTIGGWGTSTSGHSWTATVGADSQTQVAANLLPGLAQHKLLTTGVRICVAGPNVTDSDQRFLVNVSGLATGAPLYAGVTARYTDSSNHYYFRIDFNTDQTIGWNIFKRVAGVDTSLGSGTVSGLTHATAALYWGRAKVVGTSLMLKLYSDTTGEPLTWTTTISDSAISAAGQVGPRSEKPSANTTLGAGAFYGYYTCGPYADAPGKALAYDLEIAWGADLTADPSTWRWTPVTSDIYLPDANSPAINTTFGRSDWAGQAEPAGLAAVLDNTSWRYAAYNPASPNYPNVVHGTPVRERLLYNWVRFFGFSNGFTPTWDLVTNQPTADLSASGSLRRLGQGTVPLRSPLTRSVLAATSATLRQYWPLEDKSAASTAASAFPSGIPMTSTNSVKFGTFNISSASLTFIRGVQYGTDLLPQLNSGGQLSVSFPATSASSFTAQVTTYVDVFNTVALVPVFEVKTPSATFPRWQFISDSNPGAIGVNATRVMAIDNTGTATQVCALTGIFVLAECRIDFLQSGGNISVTLKMTNTQGQTFTAAGSIAGTLSGAAGFVANPTAMTLATDFVVGHVRFWDGNSAPDFQTATTAVSAWVSYNGETAGARLARLCAEQGVPLAITGNPDTLMGPQSIASFLSLIRECEAADLGQLYDGSGAGLGYIARSARYNRPAAVTVDASQEQLSAPFQPKDDDQQTRNRWTVNRSNGSYAVVSDDDPAHPSSTKRVGTYEDSTTVNLGLDSQLISQASWRVHLGTNQGFRYPTLPLDLFRNPEIAGAWLDVDLLGRVDVTNLPAPHPPGTVSLVVNGYSEAVGDFAWDVVGNCSPYRPWEVFTIQDARLGRIETDGSILHQNYSAGATSLLVDSTDELWTTGAVSFDVEIRGWQIHVTNISGSSSPQTFTVTAIPGDLGGGNSVKLWKPGVLAL